MKRTIQFLLIFFLSQDLSQSQILNWQPYGQQNGGASTFAWNNAKTKLYKGTYNSGIEMSLDSGQTWTNIYPLATGSVYSITVKNDTLFAEFSGCNVGGIRYTTNDGASWTRIDNGVNAIPNIYEISSSSSSIFVAGYDYLYHTNDNGLTWQSIPTPHTICGTYTVDATDDLVCAVGFSGVGQKIYVSQDDGDTWTTHNRTSGTAAWGLTIHDNDIYLGTFGGLHRSSDFGNTWNSLGVLGENIIALRFFGQYGFLASANNPNPFTFVYFSSDGGNTWNIESTGLPNDPEILDFAIFDSTVIAGGWGSGMWSTQLPSLPLGVPDVKKTEAKIFPNPARDFFLLTLPDDMKKERCTVEVLNITGEKVFGSEFPDGDVSPIDISAIANGVYMVRVSGESTSATVKLIKY